MIAMPNYQAQTLPTLITSLEGAVRTLANIPQGMTRLAWQTHRDGILAELASRGYVVDPAQAEIEAYEAKAVCETCGELTVDHTLFGRQLSDGERAWHGMCGRHAKPSRTH